MAKKQMISPVLCLRCGETYDLANVEVVARYADCTMFKTPCCGRTVDDRTWVGSPAIRKLDEEHLRREQTMDAYGMMRG
jgi:hypothetical protein